MSTKYIKVLPRIDSIDNWRKHNPILKKNELCIVLMKRDICKWKIGDGKTPFKKLKYIRKLSEIKSMLCYACIPETHEPDAETMHIITMIDINPLDVDKDQQLTLDSNSNNDNN